MNTNIIKKACWLFIAGTMVLLSSCLDDLNQTKPNDEAVTDIVNEAGAQAFLAKIYSGFGLSGNQGPDGENDLSSPDGDQGTMVFLRGMITLQEFPTDEAIWNWKDPGIVELVNLNWDYTTKFAYTFYQRAMLNIRYCQEFLRLFAESSDIPNINLYRNEVRAIRDLNYYYLIDIYGNPGIIWDDSPFDDKSWYPSQIGRKEAFTMVVNDLEDLAANSNLPDAPSIATYGRITKPVVWTILAKMYLNAEVYTGTTMYDKAVAYCEKVINAGFGLENNYINLFCGDNHLTTARGNEIIFALQFDNTNAKSHGGTSMFINGAYGGNLSGNWFGANNSGWTCIKPKETLISKFDYAPDGGTDRLKSNIKQDSRYLFTDVLEYVTEGVIVPEPTWPFDPVTGEILYEVKSRRDVAAKLDDWDAGYLCYKFTNLGWDNARVDLTEYPNTDFPLFRLADIYLMYAECAVRGHGNTSLALQYVNDLRKRAYKGDTSVGQITSDDLTLDFILDERARELYWEGHRRTDLVRFGKFTQNYAWPYKGGALEGIANIDTKFNIYPISDKDLTSNPNLKQNPGYRTIH